MKLTKEQKPNEWDCSLCYQESDEALFNGVDRVMTEGINKQPEDLLKLGYVHELAITSKPRIVRYSEQAYKGV